MKNHPRPRNSLAQFAGDAARSFNTLEGMAGWAAKLGLQWHSDSYMGSPPHRPRKKAAESQGYCDELLRHRQSCRASPSRSSSTHLQGQRVASHPAYDVLFGSFAPPQIAGDLIARQAWAVEQLTWSAIAPAATSVSAATRHILRRLLAWPFFYPRPQRPAGLYRRSLQGNLGALASHPCSYLDEVGRRCLLRTPPRRRPARRGHLRALSWRRL